MLFIFFLRGHFFLSPSPDCAADALLSPPGHRDSRGGPSGEKVANRMTVEEKTTAAKKKRDKQKMKEFISLFIHFESCIFICRSRSLALISES